MSHADVVISNVTCEVSRVFSGSRSMKDLRRARSWNLIRKHCQHIDEKCGNNTSVRIRCAFGKTARLTTRNLQKEMKLMTNRNNSINVPEAREAMDRFKMEAASEVGVNLKDGYNGDLTSREAGSVGGQMVKKMIEAYEQQMH